MSVEAIDVLRRRIAQATGRDFVEPNCQALSILIPHSGSPDRSDAQVLPLTPGSLVARRNRTGTIIELGLIDQDNDPLHSFLEREVGVTLLDIGDPDIAGAKVIRTGRDLSEPTREELIALLIPRS